MRLRRSVVGGLGFKRKRRGKGFAYYGLDGQPLSDADNLARIKDLVIPPAWKKVWICPHANGHIQAVGTDAAGRRQYLYHQAWQQERAEEKFDRVLVMSEGLSAWRDQLKRELAARGLGRERMLALALHLLDLGYFRTGNQHYADENESYGIASLLREHVTVRRGPVVAFDYPAKSGVRRELEIEDPAVVRAVRSVLRCDAEGDRFLVYRAGSRWAELRAEDLNARFKEMVGDEFSVKDLRTWHGTVLAAMAFAEVAPAVSARAAKRAEAAVMKAVAAQLGNTPAVARGSYVDPRVVVAYEHGATIEAAVRRSARSRDPVATQAILEKATRTLVRRSAKLTGTESSGLSDAEAA
jgi:DNA topoisomerase IB